MMMMSGRVLSCCVALFFALTSVSAVRTKINSINDLKQINFGQSVPKHSLLLLHWFANAVHIDGNNVITLTFDPNNGDYCSHYYGNFEELLVPLRRGNGNRYYTIGNLNQETTMQLPSYVVRPPREYEGQNRDRILIRATEQNTGGRTSQRIDQVFLTQHAEYQNDYDPDHTYQITTNLLREIREFSVGGDQQRLMYLRNRYRSNADDFHLRHIRSTWGELACLGLLLCIVIQEKHIFSHQNKRPQIIYTSEINYRPENIYRPEIIENNEDDNALSICIVFLLVIFLLFIIAFF